MLKIILLVADAGLFVVLLYVMFESIKEQEPRAPKVAACGAVFALVFAAFILWIPVLRIPLAIVFGLGVLFLFICLVPGRPDQRALKGAMGYMVAEPKRHDERDITFARARLPSPESDAYRKYYTMHPEKEEKDAKRREKGFLGIPGKIDGSYRPNVAMIFSSFSIAGFLGPHAKAEPQPDTPPAALDPRKATEIVKKFALHVGADLVGICRVNPLWVYSHRGEIHHDNWDDWGTEIKNIPPFAVVMATEMDEKNVGTAPHTPAVVESGLNYAKGSYLSTIMARWFAHMGYQGIAEHSRHYDLVLPPLAVDAGLGEVGRLGYLMAPKLGPRIRLFATLTDMPLVPDKPISIGGDAFCKRCIKCAESCPSRSISLEGKVVHRGAEKWKLNDDTCFGYWGKIGTDCCICMAICPFSRPNTLLHNVARWFVARSPVAQRVFPYVDNFLYGRKWRPKASPHWIAYPQGRDAIGTQERTTS